MNDLGLEPDYHFKGATKSNDIVRVTGIPLHLNFLERFSYFYTPFVMYRIWGLKTHCRGKMEMLDQLNFSILN